MHCGANNTVFCHQSCNGKIDYLVSILLLLFYSETKVKGFNSIVFPLFSIVFVISASAKIKVEGHVKFPLGRCFTSPQSECHCSLAVMRFVVDTQAQVRFQAPQRYNISTLSNLTGSIDRHLSNSGRQCLLRSYCS